MTRIVNPHVDTDHGHGGLCAPAGECPGHVHVCCPVEGVTYQCVICKEINTYSWDEIDAINEQHLSFWKDGTDAVRLPDCSSCGGQPFLNHSNVEYGVELPHHYTLAAVKVMAQRPAFKHLLLNHHADHERFQGEDFSHLPEHERPPHHRRHADYST
jgi:hypothetical protein